MQNKNLPIFLVVAALILFGWTAFVHWRWPQKPVDEEAHLVLPVPILRASLPGNLQTYMSPVPGIGNAVGVASQLAIAEWAAGPLKPPQPPSPKPPAPQPVVKAAPKPKMPHIEDIHLGGDGFNLQVALTTKGGGVESVGLPNFQEASAEGKPVWEAGPDGTKKPMPLALVPKNPFDPSDRLYAYEPSNEAHPEHPLAALGDEDWALKSTKNGPDEAEHVVVFTAEVPDQNMVITKTYHLNRGDYHIGLTLEFNRKPGGDNAPPFRYQLAGAHGLPIEGVWYTYTFRNAFVGRADAGGHVWRDQQTSQQIAYQGGGTDVQAEDKAIQYAAVATQYFTAATIVDDQQENGVDPGKLLAWVRPTVDGQIDQQQPQLTDVTVRAVSQPFEVKPGEHVVHKYLLYNGPVKVRLLGQLEKGKPVDSKLIQRYETTLGLYSLTDYGKFGFWTDIIVKCTNIMHSLLWVLHNYVMPWSYGLCIILLTVIVRGCMFPMSRRQAISSAKMQAKMAEIAPDVKKLEEKYKNDSMGLQQAKNELYLKRGVHPLAMMGSCWMLFLQMPIYLGLFYGLQESIYFRLAPFLYIENLAAPDMLFRWGMNVPIISHYLGPYFNLLPIIAVILQMMQQKIMTPPPTDEQQAMQQKMMKYMMIMFGFIFYKFAAGLCIYYIASSVWTLTERKLLLPKTGAPATPGKPGPPGPGSGGVLARRKPSPPDTNGNGTMQKVKDMWEKVLKEAKKK